MDETRYCPDHSLPPYSYVPGKFPHPLRDPQGHSYQAPSVTVTEPWEQCDAYLWGIDLFNRGYYWEAHESWEALWHAAGRRSTTARFCQALIKLAAAAVKAREGQARGVRRHAQRARELLEGVSADRNESSFMGLSLEVLMAHTQLLIDDPQCVIDQRDEPVVRVLPWQLEFEIEI